MVYSIKQLRKHLDQLEKDGVKRVSAILTTDKDINLGIFYYNLFLQFNRDKEIDVSKKGIIQYLKKIDNDFFKMITDKYYRVISRYKSTPFIPGIYVKYYLIDNKSNKNT